MVFYLFFLPTRVASKIKNRNRVMAAKGIVTNPNEMKVGFAQSTSPGVTGQGIASLNPS